MVLLYSPQRHRRHRGCALTLALSSMVLMASCLKDEAPTNECDIESAWVEGKNLASCFYDAADMRKDHISSTETEIIFTVRSLVSMPRRIPVSFRLTPGAFIEPASGSVHDFSVGPVTYTVTSEDGQWKRVYSVSFQEPSLPVRSMGFEHVEVREASDGKNGSYHHFYEYDAEGCRRDIWDSGNLGAIILKNDARPEDMPTYSVPDGYQGKAICLNTQSTGFWGSFSGKPIAAGNLFWGKFIVDKVMTDALKATQFGIPFNEVPQCVTGYYKYQPGPEFTNQKMETVPGRTDEASIYAVFYRNKDDNGQPYFLYGDDVDSDAMLRANPQVYKTARVGSLPPTDQWTRFEMFFEGRDADTRLLKENGFNLALVFSSSKDGARFEGAVGSTLYIDEVEIVSEKVEE